MPEIRKYNPDSVKAPVTIALIVLNVIAAIVDMATGEMVSRLFWVRGFDVYYGEYWRVFTSGWAHANLMHLGFNMWGLWILGSMFERLNGPKRMLVVYLVSLMSGSGLALLFSDPAQATLGASGAVFGLMGAVTAFFYVKAGSVGGMLRMQGGRQIMFWLVLNAVFSAMPGISFLGHFGGFVPGLILGVYYEKAYEREADIYHHASAGLLVVGVLAMCVYACVPFNKPGWMAMRAVKAYEHNDEATGDEWLEKAEAKDPPNDTGAGALVVVLRMLRDSKSWVPVPAMEALTSRILTPVRAERSLEETSDVERLERDANSP